MNLQSFIKGKVVSIEPQESQQTIQLSFAFQSALPQFNTELVWHKGPHWINRIEAVKVRKNISFPFIKILSSILKYLFPRVGLKLVIWTLPISEPCCCTVQRIPGRWVSDCFFCLPYPSSLVAYSGGWHRGSPLHGRAHQGQKHLTLEAHRPGWMRKLHPCYSRIIRTGQGLQLPT